MQIYQRFDGRFWPADEILTVLAIHYGEAAPNGRASRRAWRLRTLIASYRDFQNAKRGSATYGKDWKLYLKKDIVEFRATGRLPYNAMRDGVERLRAAEMLQWVLNGRPVAESASEIRKLAVVRSAQK